MRFLTPLRPAGINPYYSNRHCVQVSRDCDNAVLRRQRRVRFVWQRPWTALKASYRGRYTKPRAHPL